MSIADIFSEAGIALAYGGVGILLMVAGFGVIDVLTPGKLNDQVFRDHNTNASLVVASGLIAVATIATVAILTSEDGVGWGLLSALIYGVVGLIVLAVSFVIIDLLTPGKLGAIVVQPEYHPAALVTASAHIAVGAIVAAAIS